MPLKTECITLKKCNKDAQHNIIVNKLLKNSIGVLGGTRTATWPAAAGTTEFLNHMLKNVL
jgi:hypothetical protein